MTSANNLRIAVALALGLAARLVALTRQLVQPKIAEAPHAQKVTAPAVPKLAFT
jgi:hypothetical protein